VMFPDDDADAFGRLARSRRAELVRFIIVH
jgi:hypothetical protein